MPKPADIFTSTCTIAAGESLSSPADLAAGVPCYLIMPSDWNYAGGLSMQISVDGVDYYDVFNREGREMLSAAVVPGVVHPIISDVVRNAAFLKLRSGSREQPVVQEVARTFSVILLVNPVVTQLPG